MSHKEQSKASKGPWVTKTCPNGPGYYIYSEGDDCVVVTVDRSRDASLKYQTREEADAHMLGAARGLYDAALRVLNENASTADWNALRKAVVQAEGKN